MIEYGAPLISCAAHPKLDRSFLCSFEQSWRWIRLWIGINQEKLWSSVAHGYFKAFFCLVRSPECNESIHGEDTISTCVSCLMEIKSCGMWLVK